MEFYARSPQCIQEGWVATGNEIDEKLCTPLPEVPEGMELTKDFLDRCRRDKFDQGGLDEAEKDCLERVYAQLKRRR